MKDPGNQWAEKPLSVRLDQIKKQWLNLGPQQLLMLDNLILSAEYLEEQLAMKTELSPNATPRTQAARHNMGSVEEPHYVVDEEVAAGLERELSVALSATTSAWISVEDRLPEEKIDVLVLDHAISGEPQIQIATYLRGLKGYNHQWMFNIKPWQSGPNYHRVTHWMPLPEATK